jgi:hypothetical protein
MSSTAGVRGLGRGGLGRRLYADVVELSDMLLLAECMLCVGSGGASLNRLSRYAGLLPDVERRGRIMTRI